MTFKNILNRQGQVAVEYVLLMVVVLTITLSVMNNIKQFIFLRDGENCENGSQSFACKLQNLAKVEDPNLKYFTIKM